MAQAAEKKEKMSLGCRWIRCLAQAFLSVGMALFAATPSWALGIEVGWYGTVSSVAPGLAAVLPPASGIEPGAEVYVGFVFETTTPDVNADPTRGDYEGAVVSWTMQIGSVVFTAAPAAPLDRIEVLLAPMLTIYWPTTSVVATTALAGLSAVESDVFFRTLQPNALPSDALPLFPLEPTNWDVAVAGIIDATTGEILIDIDLTDTCVGSCAVVIPAVPVPAWATAGLGLLLLLCGSAYLYARRGEPSQAPNSR
jgi:hypothetical protein